MLSLLTAAIALAACPRTPELRDPDGQVTVLAQNLKFIATGSRRAERAALLRHYLDDEGANVDLLLLSEARLTGELEIWRPDWCFYAQSGDRDGYRWVPAEERRSPGGLVIGVRQLTEGTVRTIGTLAGRRYRARPVSFAEGILGPLARYYKGWAGLVVDDTQILWTHAQASYRRRPERGAGSPGRGRVGQFEDLATDLGRPSRATLITGDMNLLSGYTPHCSSDEPRVCGAREIDDGTVTRFRERTGLDLGWFASAGTFAGSFDKSESLDTWDLEAPYDRVGVNAAFLSAHPGTQVSHVDIGDDSLRVSDHLGLRISIPFSLPAVASGARLPYDPR